MTRFDEEQPSMGDDDRIDSFIRRAAAAPPAPPDLVKAAVEGAVVKRCPHCGVLVKTRRERCPVDGTALELLPDPFLGQMVAGRYLVEKLIGSGGMSSVYRARHQWIGRDVAIKVLTVGRSDPNQRERLLREAQAANRIDHEHIVDVTDFGETDDGRIYLVMEYLRGRTLAELLEAGPLGLSRAVHIIEQVAQGLARAHEIDVIHRDVKPGNIFLVRQAATRDYVKLLDFGIAKVVDAPRITESGIVIGTPEYMSPEQARGFPAEPRSDLYAVGCLLYEAVTGYLPFTGSVPKVLIEQATQKPRPPSSLVGGIPPELERVILTLLEKNPENRYRDAYHLLETLAALYPHLPAGEEVAASFAPEQRSKPPSERPLHTDLHDEIWVDRASLYRRLVSRIYRQTDPPPWVGGSLQAVDQGLLQMKALREEMANAAREADRFDAEASATRVRIGRALDELARNESRMAGEIAGLEASLRSAEAADESAARELVASVPPAAGVVNTSQEANRTLLETAAAFAEARRGVLDIRAKIESKRAVRDDLVFQIQQLRGRLNLFNAGAQDDKCQANKRTDQISLQMREISDRLMSEMERLSQHLSRFPESRGQL